jgi:four helix bundle protein
MVRNYKELRVYQKAFELMMEIFRVVKNWPKEERYNLTDQILRSSRSVCSNIAEGWRRRKYKNVFANQIDSAGGSATETQVWLDVALSCGYLNNKQYDEIYEGYNEVGRMLTAMFSKSEQFSNTNC